MSAAVGKSAALREACRERVATGLDAAQANHPRCIEELLRDEWRVADWVRTLIPNTLFLSPPFIR
jgi:hypothetical protein